jgi:hypothetical protein
MANSALEEDTVHAQKIARICVLAFRDKTEAGCAQLLRNTVPMQLRRDMSQGVTVLSGLHLWLDCWSPEPATDEMAVISRL